VYGELERNEKEVVMADFRILSQHFHNGKGQFSAEE
jgi:hypothetical protein